uniref:Uncharacterized protein n=1 Tax=Rhizophora mucronata TaxID=61149 RepID=A0A2P2QUX7_RHIMU
MQIFAVLYW